MREEIIENLVRDSRKYFNSGETLNISFREQNLRQLKTAIKAHEQEILKALSIDLGKSQLEGYMCEVGLTLSEIDYMLKHLRKFSKEQRVRTPLAQFHSRSFIKPSPYGVVLIMSPWNYPFLLAMEPLVDALAAGNTAVIKPSSYSPRTSEVIGKIVKECFDGRYVSVITGGREENQSLLKQHFDYIFFTGSKNVGREVLRSAAEHLTPVTLELGGKSPCIVDETANLRLAARRILFGKFLNCGQTCVAPDYIICQKSIKDALVSEIKKCIVNQFGVNPLDNEDYGKIINNKHFNRIAGLIVESKVVHGGKTCEDTLKIEPTVLDNVSLNDKVMCEEIFGPILPIMTYDKLENVISYINEEESPLALYIFSSSKSNIKKVTTRCGFGGGCINDTIIHLATSEMGFGGFGESGMGSYHGKAGFDTFSHYKSIVDKKTWIDFPMRYQPYSKTKEKIIKLFMR